LTAGGVVLVRRARQLVVVTPGRAQLVPADLCPFPDRPALQVADSAELLHVLLDLVRESGDIAVLQSVLIGGLHDLLLVGLEPRFAVLDDQVELGVELVCFSLQLLHRAGDRRFGLHLLVLLHGLEGVGPTPVSLEGAETLLGLDREEAVVGPDQGSTDHAVRAPADARAVLDDVGQLVRDEATARLRLGYEAVGSEVDVRAVCERFGAQFWGENALPMDAHSAEVDSERSFELASDRRVQRGSSAGMHTRFHPLIDGSTCNAHDRTSRRSSNPRRARIRHARGDRPRHRIGESVGLDFMPVLGRADDHPIVHGPRIRRQFLRLGGVSDA
jgi:hypothetical protein